MKNKTNILIRKLANINLHQLIVGFITVIIVCLIRHILLIHFLDLPSNILLGSFGFLFRLLTIDFFKEWLDKLDLNFQLGQILWGKQYLGGDNVSNTVSVKDTVIKDKLYMAHSGEQEWRLRQRPHLIRLLQNNQNEPITFELPPTPVTNTPHNIINFPVPNHALNLPLPPHPVNTLVVNPVSNEQPLVGPTTTPNNVFRTAKGELIEVSVDNEWIIPRRVGLLDYNYNFNKAFNIYRTFPKENIMNDYDTLINTLPNMLGKNRFHNNLPDSLVCVLKLAAINEGILSDESRQLLGGLGYRLELTEVADNLPGYLTPAQREQIGGDLVSNRTRMSNILS